MSRADSQAALKLRDRRSFGDAYLKPALQTGLIEMTVPDKPTSRLVAVPLGSRARHVSPSDRSG